MSETEINNQDDESTNDDSGGVDTPITYRDGRTATSMPKHNMQMMNELEAFLTESGIQPDGNQLLVEFDNLADFDAELAEGLVDDPEYGMYHIEYVARSLFESDTDDNDLRARVVGFPEDTTVGDLRADDVGELVSIKCRVSKVSKVDPRDHRLVFQCPDCGITGTETQDAHGGALREPDKYSCGCEGAAQWEVIDGKSESADTQKLIIADLHESSKSPEPADILCHIDDDISDTVTAGERITLTAIVRKRRRSRNQKPTNEHDIWLYGIGVEPEQQDYETLEIEDEEVARFEEIKQRDDHIQYLVNSIAPTVMGDFDDVKLSLLLQLVGASEIPGDNIRRMMHVLLLGEPGTAKSTLMDRIEEIAPLVQYASGDSSSAAGLSATTEHEDRFGSSEWTLKAGTLPRAHGGLAIIDELDKASEETKEALHTPMAKGLVEVNKAADGTLKAETDMLVGANPIEERFDRGRYHVVEQVPFEPALFSRFDLVWIFEDKPGTDLDREIIDSRADLLKSGRGTNEVMEDDLLTKYIAYARRHYDPTLTDEAVDFIREEFFDLRAQSEDGRVAVTHRKYDALVRITLASARLRHSDVATVEDAQCALYLLKQSLQEVGMNEHGELDADIYETGRSSSQRERKQDLWTVIEDADGPRVTRDHIVAEMANLGHEDTKQVLADIEKEVKRGDLYEPDENGEYIDTRGDNR